MHIHRIINITFIITLFYFSLSSCSIYHSTVYNLPKGVAKTKNHKKMKVYYKNGRTIKFKEIFEKDNNYYWIAKAKSKTARFLKEDITDIINEGEQVIIKLNPGNIIGIKRITTASLIFGVIGNIAAVYVVGAILIIPFAIYSGV